MSSKLLHFSLFIHGFQTTLFQTWNHIFFILIDSFKRSSNLSNWLSRIPTQSSLVNSELLLFITIQYAITPDPGASVVVSVGNFYGVGYAGGPEVYYWDTPTTKNIS